MESSFPITLAFVLRPKERKEFGGHLRIPNDLPTCRGALEHEWKIRGRLEASGSDRDPGFQVIEIK